MAESRQGNIKMMTYDEILAKLAEKTTDNTKELKKTRYQRRNEVSDLYGIPFNSQGDANTPASFYISVTPDLVYHLRFQFKLEIKPFTTSVKGGTDSTVVSVNNRSLSVSGGDISPNPHNHTTDAHTHNLIKGVAIQHTTADDFTVHVAGIDITPYLIEQQEGEWIEGEGVYPSLGLGEADDFYDLLSVASLMYAEGDEESADTLLEPGMKKVEIFSNAPFGVTMYLYLKPDTVGR